MKIVVCFQFAGLHFQQNICVVYGQILNLLLLFNIHVAGWEQGLRIFSYKHSSDVFWKLRSVHSTQYTRVKTIPVARMFYFFIPNRHRTSCRVDKIYQERGVVSSCWAQTRTGIGLLGKPPTVKQFPPSEATRSTRLLCGPRANAGMKRTRVVEYNLYFAGLAIVG